MVFAPLEASGLSFKYTWKSVPCNTKAPFICKHNPDFLGFHKLSNLVLDESLDIRIPSMSQGTCLTLCHAQTEVTSVAFILEDRCICAKSKINPK